MFTKTVLVDPSLKVVIEENHLQVSKGDVHLSSYYDPLITKISREKDSVIFESLRDRRTFNSKSKTFSVLFENNLRGLLKPYERQLLIFYKHFPMRVSVQNNEVVIAKFLGESSTRHAKILPYTTVEILEAERLIKITGPSLPFVTQTAANIEQVTKIRHLDRRVFQDGIYLTNELK